MKIQDVVVLLVCGFTVWVLGTIYYAYRGVAVLESGPVRYWLSFFLSSVLSAALCIAILCWRHIPTLLWAPAMLLIAIPGMIGEAVLLTHFSTFMPRIQEISAGRYGALLFAAYAVVLGIAEVVTLRAASSL